MTKPSMSRSKVARASGSKSVSVEYPAAVHDSAQKSVASQ